ncbi:OLC1v1013808C1 [Oldenlandia corymbosa var. corymbosa]|uniref:Dirigent protein n=1 Tax=Oldenlandia corymbosa var. corymbosa TaxID=529605 RepID=A0AAV1DZA6_OLDCO|nr:OLC1v1013808C1 [Oldenlandia corymbosa var. corymbosa]
MEMAIIIRSVAVYLAILVIIALGHGLPDDQSPGAVLNWFKQFPQAKPKLTKFHFYLHNIVSKSPPASTPVARAAITASMPETSFGLVNVIDAPLTEKPDSKSKLVGYCQGLFAFSSQEERSTIMTLNFVFTGGEYNGSTLSVLGRNHVTAKYREFPIIGGSGDFRLAHGIGTASTYFLNKTTGDDILEMSFVFYRYIIPSGHSEGSIPTRDYRGFYPHLILVAMIQLGHGLPDDQSPEAVEKWLKQFPQAKRKLTKIHFFLHNNLTKDPPTTVTVAQANSTATSPTRFGLVSIIDGPLTEQPDSEQTIGYSQGSFSFTSLEERSSLLVSNLVFVAGKYNGSTLSLLGRNPVDAKYRECPIVGGSGDFRMAHGITTISTYFQNSTSGNTILEMNCIFYRYVTDDE